MDRKFITKSIKETKQIAEKVAQSIIQTGEEKNEIGAVILALNGELGSGKTVFAQGFAQKLEIKEPILSPTFVIFRKFKINFNRFDCFYHFDLYRIEDSKDLKVLEFQKIIDNPSNIILIEWAEKVKNPLPLDAIFINFELIGKKRREITIKNLPSKFFKRV